MDSPIQKSSWFPSSDPPIYMYTLYIITHEFLGRNRIPVHFRTDESCVPLKYMALKNINFHNLC